LLSSSSQKSTLNAHPSSSCPFPCLCHTPPKRSVTSTQKFAGCVGLIEWRAHWCRCWWAHGLDWTEGNRSEAPTPSTPTLPPTFTSISFPTSTHNLSRHLPLLCFVPFLCALSLSLSVSSSLFFILHYILHIFVLVFVFRCCFARFFVFVWSFAMRLSAATATPSLPSPLPTPWNVIYAYTLYGIKCFYVCVCACMVYRKPVKCSWKLQCLQLAAFVCCWNDWTAKGGLVCRGEGGWLRTPLNLVWLQVKLQFLFTLYAKEIVQEIARLLQMAAHIFIVPIYPIICSILFVYVCILFVCHFFIPLGLFESMLQVIAFGHCTERRAWVLIT